MYLDPKHNTQIATDPTSITNYLAANGYTDCDVRRSHFVKVNQSGHGICLVTFADGCGGNIYIYVDENDGIIKADF